MKQIFAASIAALSVGAAMAQSYSDTAQVLSAQPIYERSSVPRQECRNETVTTDRVVPGPGSGYVSTGYQQTYQPAPQPERTIGAGTVIGAIIGGVVGHQFGNSSGGRDVGTGVGVVAGGLIGNQIENSQRSNTGSASPAYAQNGPARVDYIPETRNVQRCETVYDNRDEVTGYNVAYRYQGRDYTTRMAFDPGASMRVQVNLTPDTGAPRR